MARSMSCPGCSGSLEICGDTASIDIFYLRGRSWHKACFETLHSDVSIPNLLSASSSNVNMNSEEQINSFVPPANPTNTIRRQRRGRGERRRSRREADENDHRRLLSSYPIALPLTVLDVNPKQPTLLRDENDIESAAKIVHEMETNTRRRVDLQLLTSHSVPSLAFFSFSLEGVLHRCLAMGLVRERPYRFRMIPGTINAREMVSFCVETGQVASRADAVRIGNCLVEAGLLISLMPGKDETKDGSSHGESVGKNGPLASSSSSSAVSAVAPSPLPSIPPLPPSLTTLDTMPISLELNLPSSSSSSSSTSTTSANVSVPTSITLSQLQPFQDKEGLLFVVNLRSRGSLRDAVISHATQTSIHTSRRRKSQISGGSISGLTPLSPSSLQNTNATFSSSSSSAMFTPTPLTKSSSSLSFQKNLEPSSVENTSASVAAGITGLSPDFNNTFGIGSFPQPNYGALLSSLPLNSGVGGDHLAPLSDRTLSPHSGSYGASVSEIISSPLTPTALAGDPADTGGPETSTSGGTQQGFIKTSIPTSLSQSSIYRDRVRSRVDSNASWEVRLQNNAATFSETSALMMTASNDNAVSPSYQLNDNNNTTASEMTTTLKEESALNLVQFQLSPETNASQATELVYATPARVKGNEINSITRSNNSSSSSTSSNIPSQILQTVGVDAVAPIATPKTTSVLEFAVARIASAVFSARSSRIRQQPGVALSSSSSSSASNTADVNIVGGRKLLFGLGGVASTSSSSSSATSTSVSASVTTSILSSAIASVSSSSLPPPSPSATTRRSASSSFLNIGEPKDDPLADSDSDSDEYLSTTREGDVEVSDLRERDLSNDYNYIERGKLLLDSSSSSSQRNLQRGSSVEALDRRRRAAGLAAGKSDFQVEKDHRQTGTSSSSSPDFSGDTVLLLSSQQPFVTATLLPPLSVPPTPSILRDRRKALAARRNELTTTQWMSGWLVKQGHIRKSWKRRWFVLTGDVLVYFKTQVKSSQVAELRARVGGGGGGTGGGGGSLTNSLNESTIPVVSSTSSGKQLATSAGGSATSASSLLQTPAGTIGIKDFTLERAPPNRFPKPHGMRLASKSTVMLEYLFFADDEASYADWSAALSEALRAWEELDAEIGRLQQAQSAAALEIVEDEASQWGGGSKRRR